MRRLMEVEGGGKVTQIGLRFLISSTVLSEKKETSTAFEKKQIFINNQVILQGKITNLSIS